MTKLLSPLLILFGLALPAASLAQTAPTKDFLPPAPAGKQWKLIWHDEFDGTQLDETKWNRLGDYKRKGGWWLKEDACLNGKGTLLLRTRKEGDRYTCGHDYALLWTPEAPRCGPHVGLVSFCG